jgi:uncharacterized protein YciI
MPTEASTMKSYFCFLEPARPDMHGNLSEAEQKIFADHCVYLRGEFDAGRVLQAGTSFEAGENGFAIVILAAESKAHAVAIMQADPAVAAGLLLSRVTAYDIFLDRGI